MVAVSEISRALQSVATALDLPEEVAEEAILRYDEIAAWLADDASDLRAFSPEIYPQGSFRLGTPIRPLLHGEEFDIDLVCRLRIPKERTTQADLKHRVGKRLREKPDLNPVEKRRCWTLNYPKRFHLDVLPCIPDSEATAESILVTDTDLLHWQHSNPIGYANWFFDRMRPVLAEERMAFAKAAGVDVEDVPEWRVRTPLQRAVQLLKRHRDLRFTAQDENRPVSILITTLAARAYNQERDVYTALANIATNMPRFVESRETKWWVPNPAHPPENFADKWNEKPSRKEAFDRWLRLVRTDLADAAVAVRAEDAVDSIEKRFGSPKPITWADSAVPALSDASHRQAAPWPQRDTYRCSVVGSVHPDVKKGRKLWPVGERSLPKGVGLRFEAKTNAPGPYEVHWQVVNTGREAFLAGQLRGRFEPSDPPNVRWEATKYSGTHWVEAFVVKDGACVARSGRKYVRIRS